METQNVPEVEKVFETKSVLETKRIKLESPDVARAPEVLEAVLESQAELEAFLPWVKYSLTLEEVTANAEKARENFEQFETELRYAVTCQSSDQFLGMIGLIIRDKDVPCFEIGYWLRNSAAGQGYMTEAVALMEQYAFTELKAMRVEIRCAESNARSQAVIERSGYAFDARLAQNVRLPGGKLDNTLIYSKLASAV